MAKRGRFFFRISTLGMAAIILTGSQTWPADAPKPAAGTALFAGHKKKNAPAAPAQLHARYPSEPVVVPPLPWKIPEAILDLTGRGVSLYYLVPYQRVKDLLPAQLKPYPGPEKIWFRVDAIQWSSVRPRSHPAQTLQKFSELAYRFEVDNHGQRGTYPVRIYTDKTWAMLWARNYGSYDARLADRIQANFSPAMHFFQLQRKQTAMVMLDVVPEQGMIARIRGFFDQSQNSALWRGNNLDFIRDSKSILSVTRQFATEVQNAKIRTLFLSEPVQWQILSQHEAQTPDKILILKELYGNWSGDGAKVKNTDPTASGDFLDQR